MVLVFVVKAGLVLTAPFTPARMIALATASARIILAIAILVSKDLTAVCFRVQTIAPSAAHASMVHVIALARGVVSIAQSALVPMIVHLLASAMRACANAILDIPARIVQAQFVPTVALAMALVLPMQHASVTLDGQDSIVL